MLTPVCFLRNVYKFTEGPEQTLLVISRRRPKGTKTVRFSSTSCLNSHIPWTVGTSYDQVALGNVISPLSLPPLLPPPPFPLGYTSMSSFSLIYLYNFFTQNSWSSHAAELFWFDLNSQSLGSPGIWESSLGSPSIYLRAVVGKWAVLTKALRSLNNNVYQKYRCCLSQKIRSGPMLLSFPNPKLDLTKLKTVEGPLDEAESRLIKKFSNLKTVKKFWMLVCLVQRQGTALIREFSFF